MKIEGEFAVADARFAVSVPRGIDPLEAAPLSCAGVTTYKAVKVSGARSSDLVAIVGVGGLGHLGVQYAAIAIAGATVIGVDVQEDKLDAAKRLSATYTVTCTRPAALGDHRDPAARSGQRGLRRRAGGRVTARLVFTTF
ncbi:hypothetical protein acdb102_41050 [Acidothermaceae bacterium B102]|nr:hypothetical protein acdb102_41050 [Acidothermaceae bacterium B102]